MAATTDEIRDDAAERALDATPVPVLSAPSQTPPPRAPSKPKGGKPRIERPTIELEGKRAPVVAALLHFDGEAEPRIVSWRYSPRLSGDRRPLPPFTSRLNPAFRAFSLCSWIAVLLGHLDGRVS